MTDCEPLWSKPFFYNQELDHDYVNMEYCASVIPATGSASLPHANSQRPLLESNAGNGVASAKQGQATPSFHRADSSATAREFRPSRERCLVTFSPWIPVNSWYAARSPGDISELLEFLVPLWSPRELFNPVALLFSRANLAKVNVYSAYTTMTTAKTTGVSRPHVAPSFRPMCITHYIK